MSKPSKTTTYSGMYRVICCIVFCALVSLSRGLTQDTTVVVVDKYRFVVTETLNDSTHEVFYCRHRFVGRGFIIERHVIHSGQTLIEPEPQLSDYWTIRKLLSKRD